MCGVDVVALSRACELLQAGEIRDCSLLSHGSNYVFLLTMSCEEIDFKSVYKPRQGEVPLWDFPDGTLYKRERAAFIVSQALGWNLVPPTVIRNGPYGVGSMQWFVDAGNESTYGGEPKNSQTLKMVALFDYVVNNADRKAGHFLLDKDNRLWLVDHGLTFNAAPKLRTVLWDFADHVVPDELVSDVQVLQDKLKTEKPLRAALGQLLAGAEIDALEDRINCIIEKRLFPSPGPGRSVPWPWF